MGFGREVGDAGEMMLVEQPPHQCGIPDVAADEPDAAGGDQRFETADVCRVGHGIDHDYPILGSRRAPCMHKVLADETRAAGDQNALHPNLCVAGFKMRQSVRTIGTSLAMTIWLARE